jgi:hypothetical protein
MCDVDGLEALLFGVHEKESATFICAVHTPLNLRMCVLLAKCRPRSTKLIDADPGGTLNHLNVLQLCLHSCIQCLMVKERCTTDSSPLLTFCQNIFGLKKTTDELMNSLCPKFPHTLCFSEHHLKQIELEQINPEGYKLGASYCRKSLLKGGVCIFVRRKYDCSNVDPTGSVV